MTIYFIQASISKHIKIGFTEGDPANRLKSLQVGNHERLELIAQIHGDEEREHELHDRFKFLRVSGEWFELKDPLRSFLYGVCLASSAIAGVVEQGLVADRQRKRIEDARYLLKPNEVELNKLPTWLTRRLRTYRKEQGLDDLPTSMLLHETVRKLCDPRWLDHWGLSADDEFVSEPYNFNSKTAEALESLCSELGIEWTVSSNTWWFPGSTVRITLREKRPFDVPSTGA